MKRTENELIVDAIKFFKYGNYSERKPYLDKLYAGEGVSYNGFTFNVNPWFWIIWKPTDIEKEPQYKGDPPYKAIPDNVPIDKMTTVLDAQPWTYI